MTVWMETVAETNLKAQRPFRKLFVPMREDGTHTNMVT